MLMNRIGSKPPESATLVLAVLIQSATQQSMFPLPLKLTMARHRRVDCEA
jgi:hypothetical protein